METRHDRQNQGEKYQILAANMWPIYNFGDHNMRYQRFLSQGRPAFKSFIESVLLYDEVIVPTQDFMSLSILIGVLGENTILHLLAEKSLRFLRVDGAFSYIGNGGGIKTYEITSAADGHLKPFCAPLEEAISWALNGLIEKPKNKMLSKYVLDATTEFKVSSCEKEIRHETYMDVLKSTHLRNEFAVRSKDMDRLTGIASNGVRIYGGTYADTWKGDEIDITLLLAATNLELYLIDWLGCADLQTSNPVGHVMKAKAERGFGNHIALDGFTVLKQIASLPDIGEGVLTKNANIKDVLRIKQSRDGVAFREWFHTHCQGDTASIAKEYIAILRQVPNIQSLPARILRFITTTLLGTNPAIGVIAGTVDSFLLERWLRGSSQKLFIENLRQLQSTGDTTKT